MAQFDGGKSVQQVLFTNDSWATRRKWLRRGLLWEAGCCSAILLYAAWTNSENAILQVAFVTLAGAFVTQFGFYIFGANLDDKDKRNYVPPPNKEQATATTAEEFHDVVKRSTPPEGFYREEEVFR